MPQDVTHPGVQPVEPSSPDLRAPALHQPQVAELKVSGRPFKLKLRLRLTPAGILAIGALVSGILVATSGVVWTATSVAREHPFATRLRRR